jgi:hypothetical protein
MYSLKCSYFDKEFNSLDELVDYVMGVEWIQIMKLQLMVKGLEKILEII